MKKLVMLFLIFLIMAGYGCVKPASEVSEEVQEEVKSSGDIIDPLEEFEQNRTGEEKKDGVAYQETSIGSQTTAEVAVEKIKNAPQWKYGGPAIEGNYADSDFVDLGQGQYRMYYAIEPEVPGNQLEVYSATSSDGIKWIPESGVRRKFTVFPDVVKLPDGKWRMYFQNAGVIKSATSSDGLKWTDESGTRIDTSNKLGLQLDRVAGPTTIYDGNKYIMVYSGSILEKYKDAPNNYMAVLLWATSSDGLKFEVKDIALDSRNDKYYGFADTPDLIRWDDGTIKMFFWGYFGIYESAFIGEGFTEPEMVYEAKKENPLIRFPSSPPGDPTLGKVGNQWFIYYGQHTKGIYYAVLER